MAVEILMMAVTSLMIVNAVRIVTILMATLLEKAMTLQGSLTAIRLELTSTP